jgi:hypothetical protein
VIGLQIAVAWETWAWLGRGRAEGAVAVVVADAALALVPAVPGDQRAGEQRARLLERRAPFAARHPYLETPRRWT